MVRALLSFTDMQKTDSATILVWSLSGFVMLSIAAALVYAVAIGLYNFGRIGV